MKLDRPIQLTTNHKRNLKQIDGCKTELKSPTFYWSLINQQLQLQFGIKQLQKKSAHLHMEGFISPEIFI